MIPMTMRAIMAPEPEADVEETVAVILIASFSVIASNLHVTFHRFPCHYRLSHVLWESAVA